MRLLAFLLLCVWTVSAEPPQYAAGANVKALFDSGPLSSAPEAKWRWKLVRVQAQRVNGQLPLVLIHGLSTDFWASFEAWCADSPEASSIRKHFQLWKFLSPNDGINAAVGYSKAYTGFDESLAAYLNRFIERAESAGSEGTDGKTYLFPPGAFCILAHSQGGVTARAFLANFPDKAARVLGVVTLSSPHMGSPGATPEWVRYTLSRAGIVEPGPFAQILRGAFSEFIENGYLSTQRQSDMDMGWADYDAAGIGGIPNRQFRAWIPGDGVALLTLSARDANRTAARTTPGIDDATFEPATQLDTYCGGMDAITPTRRGGMNVDKFFVYGAYLEPGQNWEALLEQARQLSGSDQTGTAYNVALRLLNLIMAQVESAGEPGVYRLNDGFVPLQSQLILDGREQKLLFKTRKGNGETVPMRPLEVRMGVVRRHTLADPNRVRVLPGWSHYDTVTGRYDSATHASPLFPRIADDLLSVLP